MGPAGIAVFALTLALAISSSSQDFTRPPEEGDWFNKVEAVRSSLPALKKYNEFYVAVENAKLGRQDGCVSEFEPRLRSYSTDIEAALGQCKQFVPQGPGAERVRPELDATYP